MVFLGCSGFQSICFVCDVSAGSSLFTGFGGSVFFLCVRVSLSPVLFDPFFFLVPNIWWSRFRGPQMGPQAHRLTGSSTGHRPTEPNLFSLSSLSLLSCFAFSPSPCLTSKPVRCV